MLVCNYFVITKKMEEVLTQPEVATNVLAAVESSSLLTSALMPVLAGLLASAVTEISKRFNVPAYAFLSVATLVLSAGWVAINEFAPADLVEKGVTFFFATVGTAVTFYEFVIKFLYGFKK